MAMEKRRTTWQERWRGRLHDWQWVILGAAWVVALALGYAGFARHSAARGTGLSPRDIFYLVLQLIPMGSGAVSPPIPWELEVARLLLPAVAAYTAVRALLYLFRDQVLRMRLWWIRDHTIICGLGRKGRRLAEGFAARGLPVVVIESDAGNALLEQCRTRGQVVLVGDARDPAMLRRARLERARYLIAVCSDDGANAEIAAQAHQIVQGRTRGRLKTVLHIVDPQLSELLRRPGDSLDKDSFDLEMLNVYDQGARLLLTPEYAPWLTADRPRPAHILVVGMGYLGQMLVVRAVEQWRGRGTGQRLRITVFDRVAGKKVRALGALYPEMGRDCDLLPVEADLHAAEFYEARFLYDEQGQLATDAAYFCIGDDALNLEAALTLLHHRGATFPLVVRMAEGSGLANLLREGGAALSNVHAFGLLDRTLTPDVVLAGPAAD